MGDAQAESNKKESNGTLINHLRKPIYQLCIVYEKDLCDTYHVWKNYCLNTLMASKHEFPVANLKRPHLIAEEEECGDKRPSTWLNIART